MRLPRVWTAPGPDEHEQVLEAVQLSATVSGKAVTVEGVLAVESVNRIFNRRTTPRLGLHHRKSCAIPRGNGGSRPLQ